MTQPIIYRKYKEGDEKDILELGRICFFITDLDYWMKQWIWQYKENPFGNYLWVAEHKGEIVAQQAYVPFNIKVGEEVLKSTVGADAMTHPNYRRKRINNKLREYAIKDRMNAGVYLSLSFPMFALKDIHNRRYTHSKHEITKTIMPKKER